MLGYKNNQNVQPLYDYYVETDLDNFDDQPVDYSKKYSDQDSYDDCRRSKSVLKTSELPSEVSQTIKQSCNDEVKVYCIEGTPLTISYASSLSDLREVGTNCTVEKSDVKQTFPSVNDDDGCPDPFSTEIKKDIESPSSKAGDSPLSKEKDDVKEGKSVSFRNSTDISKASSPLMFSRSSSVASLNSFEQQSIVDDRSSVSVFSALTSGLISPSDLPDSPGEIMSPTLTDKDSPKNDVTKIGSDYECGIIDIEDKDKLQVEEILSDIHEQKTVFPQCPKMKVGIPVDSDRNSEDNEILAQQLEISSDSLDVDEVFDNADYDDSFFPHNNSKDMMEHLSKSDDESDGDDFLLQQCIELGMPSNSKENKCDLKIKDEPLVLTQNVSTSQTEIKKEIIPNRSLISIEKKIVPHNADADFLEDSVAKINASSPKLEMTTAVKPDEESDEDDELLQRCILLGMPESASTRNAPNSEGFVKSTYASAPVSYSSEKALHNEVTPKSDDDLDADEIILQQCIQLGMPEQLPKKQVSSQLCKTEFQTAPDTAKVPQIQIKKERKTYELAHSSRNNVRALPPLQHPMPQKVNPCNNFNSKQVDLRQPSPAKKVPSKSFSHKKPVDFEDDESDLLLEQCVAMGMPKKSSAKKVLDTRVFRKPEFDAPHYLFHPINDMRDNCPDGISDGDEDDAILEKCIRSGMPSPKAVDNVQNRLHSSQTRHTFRMPPVNNRPYLPDNNSESCKKYNPVRLPQNQPYAPVHSSAAWISSTSFIDVDSMRIYRTEDTPILSPSASISDLSSLSFNESFLNNSRNSDCSSESDDDDEILRRCIRSGMPEAKRAVA